MMERLEVTMCLKLRYMDLSWSKGGHIGKKNGSKCMLHDLLHVEMTAPQLGHCVLITVILIYSSYVWSDVRGCAKLTFFSKVPLARHQKSSIFLNNEKDWRYSIFAPMGNDTGMCVRKSKNVMCPPWPNGTQHFFLVWFTHQRRFTWPSFIQNLLTD